MTRDLSLSERIDRLELPFDALGVDTFGISKKHLKVGLAGFAWMYRNYFRVKAHGVENVPPRGRAMLVGNHSGGVAIDGAMVIAAMFLELDPPRLAQAMTEKFINRMPFASTWTSRTGQFTGLPETAERLLNDERLLLVFPEGARGTAKLYKERHSLVDFGTGFIRLVLQTKSPIIPVAVLGGGEAFPTIRNSYTLGKLMGAPYVPITSYLLPVPLPARMDIYFGKPMVFEGNGTEEDEVIERYVEQVKEVIAGMIASHKDHRLSLLGSGR